MTFAFQESERILDAAIECTFPASDPIAVHSAFRAACDREATPPDEPSASHDQVRAQTVLGLVDHPLDP
jgi:hypothetical protein